MKFETVLFGAAFLALAALSWPEDKNRIDKDRIDAAALADIQSLELTPVVDIEGLTASDVAAAVASESEKSA